MARRRPYRAVEASSYPAVIGIDEVGRGSLVASVVVAAVYFEPKAAPGELIESLDDSKKLSRRQRLAAYDLIMGHCKVSVIARSARVIDQCGIRVATLDAMGTAWRRLVLQGGAPATAPVVVDGSDLPAGLPAESYALPRADGSVCQVAAASIVAKVVRGRLCEKLGARIGYGIDRNDGYGTAEHMEAIKALGPSPHHRTSWKGVRQLSFDV